MKTLNEYQTPCCFVCDLEVEGDILMVSRATWGASLDQSLNYQILGDDELN